MAAGRTFGQTPTLQAVTDQGRTTTNPVIVRHRDGLAFNVDPRNGNVKVHFLRPSTTDMRTLRFDCTSNDVTAGWEFYNSNTGKSLLYIRQISGFVGINTVGTPSTMYRVRLAVNGDMLAHKVKVTVNNWADFVFDSSYALPSLQEVERYVAANKHLPDIPSAQEICIWDQELGGMQAKMLQKIEELTLHLILQEKDLSQQEQLIKNNEALLREREKRIAGLEAKMKNQSLNL